jgi:hypothetical protein
VGKSFGQCDYKYGADMEGSSKRKPIQEYTRRAVDAREYTFGFICIFLDLHTIRAKRQKSLHQRLQSKTI